MSEHDVESGSSVWDAYEEEEEEEEGSYAQPRSQGGIATAGRAGRTQPAFGGARSVSDDMSACGLESVESRVGSPALSAGVCIAWQRHGMAPQHNQPQAPGTAVLCASEKKPCVASVTRPELQFACIVCAVFRFSP